MREPLLEHVGHLPVLAAFLHPHIEHSSQVDLGKVLVMLAIHDIGETVVGDVFTYDKTDDEEENEYAAAMDLLHDTQKNIYIEYEERKTLESLYAKSIDALAPITHSMYRPQVKIDNFKMKGRVIQDVIDHKRKYYEWDSVLLEVFDLCLDHYIRVQNGEQPIFIVKN